MFNKWIGIGRLTRSPELRYTNNGTPVANFTLAVERGYQNKNGEKETDYIKIVTWRKLAEVVADNLGKGRLVAVEGELQINKSQGKKGKTYKNTEINASKVKFLDWPDKNKQNDNYKDEETEVDEELEEDSGFEIPF